MYLYTYVIVINVIMFDQTNMSIYDEYTIVEKADKFDMSFDMFQPAVKGIYVSRVQR